MIEDERIMSVDTSGMFPAQKLFYEQPKSESLQDKHQVNSLIVETYK